MTASYSPRHGEHWLVGTNTDLTGVTAGSTVFFRLVGAGGNTSTEDDVKFIVPEEATVTKLRANVSSNSIAEDSTITLRKNGADTSLVVTYSSSNTGDKEATGTVSVSQGDELNIELTAGGSDTDSITLDNWALVVSLD